MSRIENDFLETRIIAIARGLSGVPLSNMTEALCEGGIKLAEITLNSPDALASITAICKIFGGRMHIGAGTVTTLQEAKDAVSAGAEFIITPNVNQQVIAYCLEREILIMPGALTPTEIAQAIQCGCRYIKIFPAGAMGPDYIRDISAPFGQTRFIPVGGITAENAASYKARGAFGLGVGGNLCRIPEDHDYSRITSYALRLAAVFQ